MRSVNWVVCVALPLVVSCGDTLAPSDVAGDYTLVGQDGRNLPQLLSATLTCDVFLTGGSLALSGAPSAFILLLNGNMDCSRGGGPIQPMGWSYSGTFTLEGRRIEFTSPQVGGGAVSFSGEVLFNNAINVLITDPTLSASGYVRANFQRQ